MKSNLVRFSFPKEINMELYHFSVTRSSRCLWFLEEANIEYKSVQVNLAKGEHHSDNFKNINPMKRVPVLKDRDKVITESGAILTYLTQFYTSELQPSSQEEWGQFHRWMYFIQAELEQPLWLTSRHETLLPQGERISGVRAWCEKEFSSMIQIIEDHLKNNEYLVNKFTAVDIMLAHTLNWAIARKFLSNDLYHCSKFLYRVKDRPVYKKIKEMLK